MDGALKTTFLPETYAKQTHHLLPADDFSPVNATYAPSGDDFFVDDLLDFSEAAVVEKDEEEEEEKDNSFSFLSVSLPQKTEPHVTNNFSVLHSEQLCLPADDLADLEWLSQFVDDSSSGYSLSFPVEKLSEKPQENRSVKEFPAPVKQNLSYKVQTKARSKRARTGGRVWSFGSPESATSSSSSSCTTSSSSLPLNATVTAESLFPVKKQKKRTGFEGGGIPQPRRCSHCLVQKTPQWRAGPLGAKTLCNACGVRYKSGRLLPEYRPACSPTFSSEVHSNNHRKVLEMRRKKESDTELAQPVQSF